MSLTYESEAMRTSVKEGFPSPSKNTYKIGDKMKATLNK
jgi:hypothetical protein